MASSRPQELRILYNSVGTPDSQTLPSSETSLKPTSRHLEEARPDEDGSDALKSWLSEVQTNMHLGMIHQNVNELQCICDTFPCLCAETPRTGYDSPAGLTDDEKLLAMKQLSKDTTHRLRGTTDLRKQRSARVRKHGRISTTKVLSPAQEGRSTPETKTHEVRHSCHVCHRLETPQWRIGPDGLDTLCNVCGLVYEKRRHRAHGNCLTSLMN